MIKRLYTSCVVDITWFVHESADLKLDWFGEIKFFSMKYSNRLLYIKRSKIFPQMEAEILVDNSLKSTYHFSCGQEPRLPLSIHWATFRV